MRKSKKHFLLSLKGFYAKTYSKKRFLSLHLLFINNNNEVYSTKEGKIKIWGQTFFIPSSSVYKGLSFESFDPKNQRIMRELEKESGERGTI